MERGSKKVASLLLATVAASAAAGCGGGNTAKPAVINPGRVDYDFRISSVELGQSVIKTNLKLVAGKEALVRAHVLCDQASIASPTVQLIGRNGATVLGTLTMSRPATTPTAEQPNNLGQSFNATIPANWVATGLSLEVVVDPNNAIGEGDRTNNTHTFQPVISAGTELDIVIVPVVLATGTGTAPPNFATLIRNMWPVKQLNVTTRAPFTPSGVTRVESDGTNFNTILSQLAALRAADNSTAYYYGVLKTDFQFGVAGLGYIGFPAAIGLDTSSQVMSHELGHNFGLLHAPCGTTGPAFPYTGAAIGTYGYDLSTQTLIPNSHKDVMSYCNPVWISDFNYEKVQTTLAAATMRILPSTTPQPLVLVQGTIKDGKVRFEPVKRFQGVPRPPAGGTHALTLRTAQGSMSYPFTPMAMGCAHCGQPHEKHFVFSVADPGPLTALEVWDGHGAGASKLPEAK